MKNLYKKFIALVALTAIGCSTDDVENRPIVEAITTPEIKAPQADSQYILLEDNGTKVAERFVWSAAKYSENVVVNYSLLMDVKDGDFTSPQTLATTTGETNAAVIVKDLNQAAIELGAIPGETKEFDVIVSSTVSGGVEMRSKTPITIIVNAYSGLIDYPFTDWYFVGDAAEAGWNNNNDNQPLFRSGTNANEYKFTGYFNAGSFKLISKLGSWAPMYGMGAGNTLVYRATESDPDPAVFSIATAGYYTFTMNVETLTYTLVPFDATFSSTYTTVGIIGSSTPNAWDASTPMVNSTFDPHLWRINLLSLNDGEAKYRANDTWDVNWGADTEFSGYATQGGPNIPVNKSKYKIYFNDLDGSYLMIPNQQ